MPTFGLNSDGEVAAIQPGHVVLYQERTTGIVRFAFRQDCAFLIPMYGVTGGPGKVFNDDLVSLLSLQELPADAYHPYMDWLNRDPDQCALELFRRLIAPNILQVRTPHATYSVLQENSFSHKVKEFTEEKIEDNWRIYKEREEAILKTCANPYLMLPVPLLGTVPYRELSRWEEIIR